MKILLDTHMIIWALNDDPKLPLKAREIILNPENDIFFSVLSLWEIEIKRIAKPELLSVTAKEISDYCKQAGFKLIELQEKSINILKELSRPDTEPPHKDPFDRMLLCQAISNDMMFLKHDSKIIGYDTDKIIFA